LKAKLITVIGARPQFVKCGIVSAKLKNKIDEVVIHTGQHYDNNMSGFFFEQLSIPKPKYNLGIGGESNTKMTAEMMLSLEKIFLNEKPAGVLVYGDTDSTLAAALVAAKLYIPLIHVESGERIYRMKYVPEEINRVITDHISNLNLCSSADAVARLKAEGLNNSVFVGDPMYDLYMLNRERIKAQTKTLIKKYNLPQKYILLTIHRLENTINESRLINILKGLLDTGIKIVWPVHPRTAQLLKKSRNLHFIAENPEFIILEPLPYIEFNSMMSRSYCVLTDSGGVIREAFFAGKYSLVPLNKTWWQNIVKAGWSFVVDDNSRLISKTITGLSKKTKKSKPSLFGDGNSSSKIVKEILKLIKQK
jgi:UDP-N-acetylglucosamine 2-epimerase